MEALSGYGLPQGRLQELSSELDSYAKGRLASHMQEAAHTALHRVKDRYGEEVHLVSGSQADYPQCCKRVRRDCKVHVE